MNKEGKRSLIDNFVWPLIVAVIVGPISWYLGNKFGPKNVDEDILKTQQEQLKTLKQGFSNLIDTLNAKQSIDKGTAISINNYVNQLSSFISASNEATNKYNIDLKPVDIIQPVTPNAKSKSLDIPTHNLDLEKTKNINIPFGDKNARILNYKNQIAVIEDVEDKGMSGVKTNLNGTIFIFFPADSRFLYATEDFRGRIVYDGKSNNEYLFRMVKD